MTYHDPASYVRLDARTILRAVYGRPVANVRHYEVWLLRSEDDGATWTFSTLAADSQKKRSFGETALVQAANGDLVAMMRTEPALGTKMWTTRSADRGRTWSQPVETPLHGHPAHLLRLRDGTLLCTYGHRDPPIGIRAAFSHDHGRTWPENEIVTLRADGSGRPGDNGYPISVELADGPLVSVYYLTREGVTGVEATRWRRSRP
jgi:Neuraminidase (sialidase)